MTLSAAVTTILILVTETIITAAQTTVYDPSPTDPRVVAALAARKQLGEVMRAVDIAGVERLIAPDILVNAPINKVVNRENIITRLKAHQISYEPDTTEALDFVGVRGDMVVIMGEEVVHPNKDAPYAGKIEHRRSTDIWKQIDGVWKLWIRQATITKVE